MSNSRALIVGISNYGRPGWDLPGCVQDAHEWRALLQHTYGFRADHITMLEDDQAGKSSVLAALHALFVDTKAGDRRLFIYAGHGTTVPRSSEDEGDLADLLDECLVLHPGQAPATDDYLLSDNELLGIIRSYGSEIGKGITIILDSCFSLGMLRVMPPSETSQARCVNIPGTSPTDGAGSPKIAPKAVRIRRFGSPIDLSDAAIPHVLVAAAREDESAWDSMMEDGQRHGVFTYFATRILSADPNLSHRALAQRCEERLRGAHFSQHPTLAGGGERQSLAFLDVVGDAGEAASPEGGAVPADTEVPATLVGAHSIVIVPRPEGLAGGARFSLEGPWNIKDPVHEKITELALKRVGIIKNSDTFTSSSGWEYMRGVFWNDDPEGYLFDNNEEETSNWSSGYTFWRRFSEYKKAAEKGVFFSALPPSPLLARSHFGDLQCLHAMAAVNGEPPQQTVSNILDWAEFLYLVATGQIAVSMRICDVRQGRMNRWFYVPPTPPKPSTEPDDDRAAPRSFTHRSTVKAMLLVGKKGSPRRRAIGALLHMVQDSFCDAHTERNGAREIVEFHTYVGQDDDKHAAADSLAPGGVQSMLSAMKAVEHSATLLAYWQAGRPWEVVKDFLTQRVFRLAEGARAASPGNHYRSVAVRPVASEEVPAAGEGVQVNFTITGFLLEPETLASPGRQEDFLFGEPVAVSPSGPPACCSYSQVLADTLELRCVVVLDMDARQDLHVTLVVSLLQGEASSRAQVTHERLGVYTVRAGESTTIVTGHSVLGLEGWGASINVAVSNERAGGADDRLASGRGDVHVARAFDLAELAQRFRPYLKFSVEDGKQEPYSPCSWRWLFEQASLVTYDYIPLPVRRETDIGRDYDCVLAASDVRRPQSSGGISNNVNIRLKYYAFGANLSGENSEPWSVATAGGNIYCHASRITPDLVNLEYWLLLPL